MLLWSGDAYFKTPHTRTLLPNSHQPTVQGQAHCTQQREEKGKKRGRETEERGREEEKEPEEALQIYRLLILASDASVENWVSLYKAATSHSLGTYEKKAACTFYVHRPPKNEMKLTAL